MWDKAWVRSATAIFVVVLLGFLLAYDNTLIDSNGTSRPSQLPAISMGTSPNETPDATPQASVIPTVDVISFQETVVAVMATMPTYTPYPHVRAVEDKVLGDQRREMMWVAQRTVTAMQHLTPILEPQPTPEPPLTPYPGPPTRTASAGTIVYTNICGTDKLISTQNKWRENIGTRIVAVCAGSTYYNPQTLEQDGPPHGALLFEDFDTATNTVLSGPDLYEVPAEVASIIVVDAVGERVTLQADTGALFYFDVATRQWVNP